MKKLYILYLAYYAALHAIMPLLYYLIRGEFVSIYKLYCPEKYYFYAAIIIVVPIVITIALILLLDKKKENSPVVINRRMDVYFYIACMYIIFLWNYIGSFHNSAVINGTWFARINLLFDTNVLLLILMINASEKCNIVLSCCLFLLASLSANSRQGALTLVFALVAMLFVTDKYEKQRKYIWAAVLCLAVSAPLVYLYSTQQRGAPVKEGLGLIDQIVGRCSYLEQVGGALYQKDTGIWVQEVFERKYSLSNQFKLCVNSLIPGDIFPADVRPNQYYRTVFLNVPEAQSKATYTSINLTFPGYILLKYSSPLFAILLTVACLLLIYFIGKKLRRFPLLKTVWTVYATAAFLDYFDWVMMLSDVLRETITVVMFAIIYYCVKTFIPRFKIVLRG